jgi:ADP-heptose:LPS heptosyltransferase
MGTPKHILVIRFSAMGDVALTIPALLSVAKAHPYLTFTVITRPFFASFFPEHPQIKAIGIDLDKYKGFFGLRKLANELQTEHQFDGVVDLHNVLRSKTITSFLKMRGLERVTFDKKRNEKKSILSGKSDKQLPHIIEQYMNTFRKAGYKSDLIDGPWLHPTEKPQLTEFLETNNLINKQEKWIGIAPFAAHEPKMWGMDNIQHLTEKLIEQKYKVLLFGGGKSEVEQLDALANNENGIISVAGKISFDQELALMKKLDTLICMDSSNMHFGCLLGIKVVSIWGATTPLLGFYPYGNEEFIVQVPKEEQTKLTLTGYGNKPATNGYNWKENISVEKIIDLISK